MSAVDYTAQAQRLREIVARAMPELDKGEQTSVLAVALGFMIGDAAYPLEPSRQIISFGAVIGVAARHGQHLRIQQDKKNCGGVA